MWVETLGGAAGPARPRQGAGRGAGRDGIRFAQCWEDADALLAALDVRAEHVCVSVASSGESTLSLLARGPRRLVATDPSPAQIACLELKAAAYRCLGYGDLLELFGARPSSRRPALYARCREALSEGARGFWDARPAAVTAGIGRAGRFEGRVELFRRGVLPLVHGPDRVRRLLAVRPTVEARGRFYREEWDTWRWRAALRLFFSRPVAGRLGADPAAGGILARARAALTDLEPACNPYLRWILTGEHGPFLPHALREASFDAIRANLDRLEPHAGRLEDLLAARPDLRVDRWNLSDVLEYVPPDRRGAALERVVEASRPGARVACRTRLAQDARAERPPARLCPLDALTAALHRRDRAFYYGALVVAEVRA